MKKIIIIVILLSVLSVFAGCENKETENSITVSAAISLKEPLEELKVKFEKMSNVNIYFNFGGSGVLQKQIEEGAPVDVFISAGKEQMDKLEEKQSIISSTREEFLKNELVIISSRSLEEIKSINDLRNKKISLAIGEIKTVPVGQYAKESLENFGLWEKVSSNIVYGKDAKDVLKYVQTGEVQAGMVYESDVVHLDKSYNIVKVPESSHKPIIYPAAVVANSKNKEAAKAFIEFIKNNESRNVFEKYKFKVKE